MNATYNKWVGGDESNSLACGDASTMLWHDKTRFLANEEEVKVDANFFLANICCWQNVFFKSFHCLTFKEHIKF